MLTSDPQGQAWSAPPAAPADESAYFKQRLALTFVATSAGRAARLLRRRVRPAGAGDPDNRRFMKWSSAPYSPFEQATLDVTREARRRARGAGGAAARRSQDLVDRRRPLRLRAHHDAQGRRRRRPQPRLRRDLDAGGAGAARTCRLPDGTVLNDRLGGPAVTVTGRNAPDHPGRAFERGAGTMKRTWCHPIAIAADILFALERHTGGGAAAHAGTSSPPATGTASRSSTPTRTRSPSFLEHPYRYLRPSATDPHADGRRAPQPRLRLLLRRARRRHLGLAQRADGGRRSRVRRPVEHHPRAGDARRRQRRVVLLRALRLSGQRDGRAAPRARRERRLRACSTSTWAAPRTARLAGATARACAPSPRRRPSSRPARAAARWSTCRSRASTTPTAATSTPRSERQDLGAQDRLQRQRRRPGFQKKLGADGWMAVAVVFVENAADADAAAAVDRRPGPTAARPTRSSPTRAGVRQLAQAAAATAPLCSDDEKKLWRQGEAVLRMGQVREANTPTRKNNGMILAPCRSASGTPAGCATRRTPSSRWRASGHLAEAKAALDFFLNAGPVGALCRATSNNVRTIASRCRATSAPARRRPTRTGRRPERRDRRLGPRAVGGARSTSRPRATRRGWLGDAPNGTVYDVLIGQIGDAARGQPRDARASSRPTRRSGRCTSRGSTTRTPRSPPRAASATWRRIAKKSGEDRRRRRTSAMLAQKVNDAFLASFVDPQSALGGSLEGSRRSKYYDGAVAEAFTWNILPDWTGTTAKATLDLLNHLRVDSGGFKRNDDGSARTTTTSGSSSTCASPNALRRAGHAAEADGYVAHVVRRRPRTSTSCPSSTTTAPPTGRSATTPARSRWSATAAARS